MSNEQTPRNFMPSFRLSEAKRRSGMAMMGILLANTWFAFSEKTGARIDNIVFGLIWTIVLFVPFSATRNLQTDSRPAMLWVVLANLLYLVLTLVLLYIGFSRWSEIRQTLEPLLLIAALIGAPAAAANLKTLRELSRVAKQDWK